MLTKSGHPDSCFVEQEEGHHEEGVGGTQHRLESQELLEGDQPKRRQRESEAYTTLIHYQGRTLVLIVNTAKCCSNI